MSFYNISVSSTLYDGLLRPSPSKWSPELIRASSPIFCPMLTPWPGAMFTLDTWVLTDVREPCLEPEAREFLLPCRFCEVRDEGLELLCTEPGIGERVRTIRACEGRGPCGFPGFGGAFDPFGAFWLGRKEFVRRSQTPGPAALVLAGCSCSRSADPFLALISPPAEPLLRLLRRQRQRVKMAIRAMMSRIPTVIPTIIPIHPAPVPRASGTTGKGSTIKKRV